MKSSPILDVITPYYKMLFIIMFGQMQQEQLNTIITQYCTLSGIYLIIGYSYSYAYFWNRVKAFGDLVDGELTFINRKERSQCCFL